MPELNITISTSTDYDPNGGHPDGKHVIKAEGADPILCDNAAEMDASFKNYRRSIGIPD